jgi:integrase
MSRPINILTATEVKNVPPAEKVKRLSDGGGLYLIIQPNGSKLWHFRYKVEGKDQVASFGQYPVVTLADARRKAEAARTDMANGITPKDRQRMEEQDQAEERRQRGSTFESVAREWYRYVGSLKNENQPWTNPKHRNQVITTLKTFVFPKLGKTAIADIKAKDVRKVIDALKNDGKWETGQRVFQRISMVFDAAIEEELIENNPCDFLRRQKMFKNKPPKGQFPALTPQQLPELVKAINTGELQPVIRLALQLSLLTAVRPGELRHAEWAELDLEEKLWLIPGGKMKMKRDHVVPLSDAALNVLYQLEPHTGRNRFLFPHRSRGNASMTMNTVNRALKRLGFHGKQTAHGFRALFSTWANESGTYRADVVEMQLAHLVGSKVSRAYNRALYLDDRRVLMQGWADAVAVAGQDSVTPIREGKRA